MRRKAFTMIELIFVIVVMGILAKFGVELLKQTFEGYSRSLFINEMQTKSANAVQTIANRLTYRIKDSVRSGTIGTNTVTWKAMDIDGWEANEWSGIVDLDLSTDTNLSSPGTLATANGTQIFFIGSNIGSTLLKYYNIVPAADVISGNFAGEDVYEYYQMIDGDRTINQVGTELYLVDGSGNSNLLTNDVSEFIVEKLGDGIHIRLCLEKTGNPLVEGTVCKDKFVF